LTTVARVRSSSGNQRATRLEIAGMFMPSPRPSATRTAASGARPPASGVAAVASDHPRVPAPSTRRPPKRSASQPPGRCERVKPQKNTDWTKPIFVSDQPNSRMRSGAATERFQRSM